MLSIIIVNWNVRELLAKTLAAIYQYPATIDDFEVIVIDNDSSDDSAEMVRNDFPEVKLVSNQKNVGFGSANNQGLEIAQGDYILFLNPDTEVQQNALDLYIDKFRKDPQLGAMGVKLLNSDGSLQPSCKRFPDLDTIIYNGFMLDILFAKSKTFGAYEMSWFDHQKELEVDQPMGAALGVRKSVLDQVGGFDQNYFMYFEEVDLCYRIKQAGFKIVYYPQASIIHHGGRSTTQAQMSMNSSWYKSFFYYLRKNKNYPALLIIMTLSLITLGKIIWLAAVLLLLFMLYKLL